MLLISFCFGLAELQLEKEERQNSIAELQSSVCRFERLGLKFIRTSGVCVWAAFLRDYLAAVLSI